MRITRYRYNNDRLDSNGHYIYIKDGDAVWNPGWQPVQTDIDSYEARHGMGYTVLTGKNSWLTGSASWGFTCVSQYILGIRPQISGLTIDPCIPSDWDGFKCTRKFRGAAYDIKVTNPDHVEKGVASISIDGEKIKGNTLPAPESGKVYNVEVVMGR